MNATTNSTTAARLPLRAKGLKRLRRSIANSFALLTLKGEREFELVLTDSYGPMGVFVGTKGECAQRLAEAQTMVSNDSMLQVRPTGRILVSAEI
jgi:hypothetical protein